MPAPAATPFRTFLRRYFTCLSIANLLFVEGWYQLRNSFLINHLRRPVAPAALAILCDVLALSVVLFTMDHVLRRSRFYAQIARFTLILAFLLFLKDLESPIAYSWLLPLMNALGASIVLDIFAILGVLAILVFAPGTERLARWLQRGALILSPFFVFNAVLVGMDVAKGDAAYAELPRHITASARQGPRVVWILFDSLDYHYAFEDRPSNVRMPALDRFRGESVDFTNALAPGGRTEISIPGLLTGKQYVDSEIHVPNDLDLTTMQGRHISLRTQRTVFADAEEMGARSAMVGIHLPYGRIIGNQLSFCEWWQWPNQFASDESFIERAEHSFAFVPSKPFTTWRSGTRQIGNHVAEMKVATALAADPEYRLVFLHLLPPHPQGMYDRDSGQLTLDKTLKKDWYFHNLALTDACFAELRQRMESSGTWDKSLVIVTADHSWRGADQVGLQIFPRIPFICHLPGSKQMLSVKQKINSVCTRDMLLAYLRGDLARPEDLASWVERWTAFHPDVPLTDDPPSRPIGQLVGP